VYVFARGPVGGFSGVYFPVRTPVYLYKLVQEMILGKKELDWAYSLFNSIRSLVREN